MRRVRYRIREAGGADWRALKELRLAALADPVSKVAFSERHEVAVAKPDSFWQHRAGQARNGRPITTLVGEGAGGPWAGMLVVFVEDEGARIAAVYLRPEHRGTGLAEQLFQAAEVWAWARPDVRRLQLDVHEGNPRAEAFYRRFGFARTGAWRPDPHDPSALEWEMTIERRERRGRGQVSKEP